MAGGSCRTSGHRQKTLVALSLTKTMKIRHTSSRRWVCLPLSRLSMPPT
ncbi:hypothetical protein EVA_12478 [gut metagenome]|uniref:Uncharacterized protein n=1 Tax=gut metagenome TaxID=749906 RepID=J9FXY0_9ZZZZ